MRRESRRSLRAAGSRPSASSRRSVSDARSRRLSAHEVDEAPAFLGAEEQGFAASGFPSRRTDSRSGVGSAAEAGRASHARPSLRDDDRYSREAYQRRYGAQLAAKRRRSRLVKRVLLSLLLVVALGAGAAFAYVNLINGNLARGLDPALSGALVKTDMAKEPFYMVFLGTDASLERDTDQSTDGVYRTDTIILARIDAPNKKVTLISLPRDTKVDLGSDGTQKLNAAYAFGGSSLAVKTVSNLAGVGISHFALVDMDGLAQVVDALGGIEVTVPIEIDDEDAGGHLDAGLQTLNGDQALILCRSRHSYDEFGAGDLYRAANQRLVLQGIAKKLLSSDVATIASTVNALSNSVKTDLKVNDIIGLAQAFQGMDATNDLVSATMPTVSAYEDGVAYELVKQTEWKAMMERVKKGEAPTASSEIDQQTGTILSNAGDGAEENTAGRAPKRGTIVVRNGSGTSGIAQTAASELSNAGYTVTDYGNADSYEYAKTIVVYKDDSYAQEAADIAEVLGGQAKAQKTDGSYLMTGDFLVVLGKDYAATQ